MDYPSRTLPLMTNNSIILSSLQRLLDIENAKEITRAKKLKSNKETFLLPANSRDDSTPQQLIIHQRNSRGGRARFSKDTMTPSMKSVDITPRINSRRRKKVSESKLNKSNLLIKYIDLKSQRVQSNGMGELHNVMSNHWYDTKEVRRSCSPVGISADSSPNQEMSHEATAKHEDEDFAFHSQSSLPNTDKLFV